MEAQATEVADAIDRRIADAREPAPGIDTDLHDQPKESPMAIFNGTDPVLRGKDDAARSFARTEPVKWFCVSSARLGVTCSN